MEVDGDESDSDSSLQEDGEWLIFDSTDNSEDIDTWLENNRPSQIEQESSGIVWISVSSPRHCIPERDVLGLVNSFYALTSSGRPVNKQTVLQLAQMHNVRCGKWLFFTDSGGKVDYLWQKIAKGIVSEALSPAISAKVSTYENGKRHVILVYNEDFTDTHEVFMSEQAIRNIGIKTHLCYKPDAYTYMNIYKNNPWGIKPTIYSSTYDIQQSVSCIKED